MLTSTGALIYDGVIGQYEFTQQRVPAYPFLEANNDILNLNESFMADLAMRHQHCGFAGYINQYLQFPPPREQPAPPLIQAIDNQCDLPNMAYLAILAINPCLDIHNMMAQCPKLSDVLGTQNPEQTDLYFNRVDVKQALHVPVQVEWAFCSHDVFVGGERHLNPVYADTSPNPTEKTLPRLIEATNRVLISNGDWDLQLLNDGALLAIQNMVSHYVRQLFSRPWLMSLVDMERPPRLPRASLNFYHP
jgi:carboxypeptidase D